MRRLSLFSSSGSGNSSNTNINGASDAAAPAPAMFSKFKGAGGAAGGHSPLDTNPISQYYDVGKQTASAGPGLIWKIYDAVRKSDRKVSEPVASYQSPPPANVLISVRKRNIKFKEFSQFFFMQVHSVFYFLESLISSPSFTPF